MFQRRGESIVVAPCGKRQTSMEPGSSKSNLLLLYFWLQTPWTCLFPFYVQKVLIGSFLTGVCKKTVRNVSKYLNHTFPKCSKTHCWTTRSSLSHPSVVVTGSGVKTSPVNQLKHSGRPNFSFFHLIAAFWSANVFIFPRSDLNIYKEGEA